MPRAARVSSFVVFRELDNPVWVSCHSDHTDKIGIEAMVPPAPDLRGSGAPDAYTAIKLDTSVKLMPFWANAHRQMVDDRRGVYFSTAVRFSCFLAQGQRTRPSNPAGCATRAHGDCCNTDDVLCRFMEGYVQGHPTVLDTLPHVHAALSMGRRYCNGGWQVQRCVTWFIENGLNRRSAFDPSNLNGATRRIPGPSSRRMDACGRGFVHTCKNPVCIGAIPGYRKSVTTVESQQYPTRAIECEKLISARSVKVLIEKSLENILVKGPQLSALTGRLRGPRGAKESALNEYSTITGQARTETTRKCRAIVEKKKNWGWGRTILVIWAQTSRPEQEIQGYPRK
ncbi:hypothetical protein V8E52_002937 [Russula decolorans]